MKTTEYQEEMFFAEAPPYHLATVANALGSVGIQFNGFLISGYIVITIYIGK
jgi:hypothetical protein